MEQHEEANHVYFCCPQVACCKVSGAELFLLSKGHGTLQGLTIRGFGGPGGKYCQVLICCYDLSVSSEESGGWLAEDKRSSSFCLWPSLDLGLSALRNLGPVSDREAEQAAASGHRPGAEHWTPSPSPASQTMRTFQLLLPAISGPPLVGWGWATQWTPEQEYIRREVEGAC